MFQYLPNTTKPKLVAEPGEGKAEPRSWTTQLSPAALSKSKRALDVCVALSLIVLLAPAFCIVAALVYFTCPGPVFFRQRRTGLYGKPFQVLKFRSMYVMEDGGTVAHATRNDARITPVGAWLRATSIDELPQLFNVLRGDMSLVGPRPHAIAHDRLYGELLEIYPRRFAVRPGITGLAQVRGLRGEIHSLSCMRRRVMADCEYIQRWSLTGDIVILLRTLPCIVKDRNAY